MQLEHGEYIQESGGICYFLHKTCQRGTGAAVEKLGSREEKPVIYFDATGGVVRKPHPSSKRVFLYSAVISVKGNDRIVPVFEMISSSHYARNITKIFTDFRTFCERSNKWPVFSKVVTDFSFANIHAIINSCNRMTLNEYLQHTYEFAVGRLETAAPLITAHLCCAHFMKMVSNDVDQYFPENRKEPRSLKWFMAKCIQLKSLESISEWLLHVSILLRSSSHNEAVKHAYEALAHLQVIDTSAEELSSDFFRQVQSPDEELTQQDLPTYRRSPFYQHFTKFMETQPIPDTAADNVAAIEKNPFFNPSFFDLIMRKYLPYCPLWSGILICDPEVDRYSNAYVENYFCQLEQIILKGKRNLKPSRFLRQTRENMLAYCKESLSSIPKKTFNET